jgi:hypothetical protein
MRRTPLAAAAHHVQALLDFTVGLGAREQAKGSSARAGASAAAERLVLKSMAQWDLAEEAAGSKRENAVSRAEWQITCADRTFRAALTPASGRARIVDIPVAGVPLLRSSAI